MKLHLFDTGFFYADGGAMFGAIPKTAWKRRYPADEENRCLLAMRSLLVETEEGRIVLIDNGAGNKQLRKLAWYSFFDLKDLAEELSKRGICPEQVTDVVLTHLHFDHCGYTTQRDEDSSDYSLAFPKATHWVGQRQWENFLAPNPLEESSMMKENMMAVADAGLLRRVDRDCLLAPSIELRLYDGHTPGQLVPYIHEEEQTHVFAGDVIPLAPSVSPDWISAYDTHPLTSYYEKIRLMDEAAEKRQLLYFCHDAYTPSGYVSKRNGHYRVIP